MTGRTVPEWFGKTPDQMPPPTVSLRIWEHAKGCCEICTRKIMAGEEWHRDHIKALADGGENRESNYQVACVWCHREKTGAENSERAVVRRKAKAHAGIKSRSSRPMPGSKASKWKKRMDGTVIERCSAISGDIEAGKEVIGKARK